MKKMTNLLKQILCALFFLIFSINALALQLGQISVNSTQDQPLNAEIELVVSSGDDLDSLKAKIAGKDIYQAQSIERVPVHEDIKITVIKDKKKSILKLSSEKPVLDPFLDLLIQIDSPKGRNFREYTVLLDPLPASQSQAESLVEPEPTPESAPEPAPEPTPESAPEPTPEPAPEPAPEPTPEPTPEPEVKTVVSKKGVTLYQIARDNKLEGVTLQQIVVGIYQTNPKAFANNNINGLEVGNKLILPSKAYYEDLSHVDAGKILKKDNDSWGSIKNKKTKKEVKPAEPVKEVIIKEPSVEINTKTFKSSISNADDNITEVIIKDNEKGGLTTLHMLLLALLLVAIIGLLIILSRKKRQASLLFNENLEQNSRTQSSYEEESNKPSESSKPTDRYIASMNNANKE